MAETDAMIDSREKADTVRRVNIVVAAVRSPIEREG